MQHELTGSWKGFWELRRLRGVEVGQLLIGFVFSNIAPNCFPASNRKCVDIRLFEIETVLYTPDTLWIEGYFSGMLNVDENPARGKREISRSRASGSRRR